MIRNLSDDESLWCAAELTEYLSAWTNDLVVSVTVDPAIPAAAWCFPDTGAIHIDPAKIDLLDPSNTEIVRGMLLHELGHAEYTHWKAPSGLRHPLKVIMQMFEEIRVERRTYDLTSRLPEMRAMFRWLLKNMTLPADESDDWGMSCLWVLVYGRVMNGMVHYAEIAEIDRFVADRLGRRTITLMREILSDAVAVEIPRGGDATPLIDLAEEWVDLIIPESDEADAVEGSSTSIGIPCFHAQEEDESADEDGPEPTETVADEDESGPPSTSPGEAPGDAPEGSPVESIILRVADTVGDNEGPPPPLSRADPRKMVEHVTSAGERKLDGVYTAGVSREMRLRAVTLSRALEQMHLPAVAKSRVSSTTPPGRLHGGSAIQLAVDRQARRPSTAAPWRASKRARTVHTPLVIGCMTDISGSMAWSERLVAEFAWIVSVAGRGVNARTAAVTYGDDVVPVVLPDETPRELRVFRANGSVEQVDRASAALDGLLGLSNRRQTSRIVFNFSDGEYVLTDEKARAERWIREWVSAGTRVVWIGCDSRLRDRYFDIDGVTFVDVPPDPEKLIPELSEIILRM